MDNAKYEFTGEVTPLTITDDDGEHIIMLQRIRSIVDIREDVPSGTLGGWVEKEDNLSISGSCWIYEEAKCVQNAKVSEDATLRGYVIVQGMSKVSGNSSVENVAVIKGHATIKDDAIVRDNAKIIECATVSRNGIVEGNAEVIEYGKVERGGIASGGAIIGGRSRLKSLATKNTINICGAIIDITMSDEELCIACVSLPFRVWTEILTIPPEEFMEMIDSTHTSDDINNATQQVGDNLGDWDNLSDYEKEVVYQSLIRSLGVWARIAQIYNRDTSGFTYIDKGYTLILEPGIPDYRDVDNKLDPFDILG